MFSQFDGQKAKNKWVKNIVGQPTGTEIGLNLCLTFVHLMNGEIWVSNNTGGSGLTFSFYLPVSNGIREAASVGSPIDLLPESSNLPFRSPVGVISYLVLVEDDNMLDRKVFDGMLKSVGVETVRSI